MSKQEIRNGITRREMLYLGAGLAVASAGPPFLLSREVQGAPIRRFQQLTMKCIVNNQVVLSRAPEGQLAAQIGSFAESVSEQGYSLAAIHRQVLLAACFSRWLQQNGVGLRSICSDHSVRYLRYRARRVRPCRGDAAALRHLIGFLRREGVIPGETKLAFQSTPAEQCAQGFGKYLLEVRADTTQE